MLVVVLAAACSNGSDKAEPSKPTNHTRPAPREFAVVFDDTGLHVPQDHRPAATYVVSFADHRSHKGVNQRVALAFSPGGPDIVLPGRTVPAGARRTQVLASNLRVRVQINGVFRRDLDASLKIDTSKAYPTPAT